LEIAVQNHIETQLSRRHTGHKPYRRFSRRPSNTEIHMLNRHKRQYFCMIQNYVQQYIDFALDTKNDHSALQKKNRLRYDTPGGAESREDSENFSPPALTSHPPRPQLSQLQTLPQQQAPSPQSTMANTRMEAARDIQSDVLSVLKRISKYTVDTPAHTLWNLPDHIVFSRYGQLNQFRRQCERAMQSCLDGQQVAPKVPKYMYFHRIFGDLLECLHMEHDRLETLKESFQELLETRNAGHTPFNHTPANTYSGNTTPLSNNMNAVLLPQVSAQSSPRAASASPRAASDTSSDTSSDSDPDDLQTLTDDSDVEEISNIQKISLLFQGLEDPDYDYTCSTPTEDLMDH
jgi:hypothetical protein